MQNEQSLEQEFLVPKILEHKKILDTYIRVDTERILLPPKYTKEMLYYTVVAEVVAVFVIAKTIMDDKEFFLVHREYRHPVVRTLFVVLFLITMHKSVNLCTVFQVE